MDYRVYLIDREARILVGEWFEATDETSAIRVACEVQKVFAARCAGVEVWHRSKQFWNSVNNPMPECGETDAAIVNRLQIMLESKLTEARALGILSGA